MKPRFSIVIPVYNVAPYLRACLDSVVAQTNPNWEAICIDDGSTDGSDKILDEYAGRDCRFRVVHQGNAGVGVARNNALELAEGEWLAFLDGDDLLRGDMLEVCCQSMRLNAELDMIKFGLTQFYNEDDLEWGLDSREESWMTLTCSEHVSQQVMDGSFCGRIYRRSRIADIRFRAFVIGEDEFYKSCCIDRAQSMVVVNQCLYAYRQRRGSAMNSPNDGRKLRSEIGWWMSWCRLWSGSQKRLDGQLWRRFALSVTERYAHLYFAASARVRQEVWSAWKTALQECASCRFLPKSNRFLLQLFKASPTPGMAYVLFYFPRWLKLKGVHR